MRLVAALATDWGVEATTSGKTVWAELEPRGRPAPERVAATFPQRPSPANAPVTPRPTPRSGQGWISELSALYRQVADTLERSAELAERHTGHEPRNGRQRAAKLELAKRARESAQRARALASRMQ
jgi:hypothetical protein